MEGGDQMGQVLGIDIEKEIVSEQSKKRYVKQLKNRRRIILQKSSWKSLITYFILLLRNIYSVHKRRNENLNK